MTDNLLPCPFCGAAVHHSQRLRENYGASVRYGCKNCGATGPSDSHADGAVLAWNRRTTEPRSDAAGHHEIHHVRDHALLDSEVYRRALDVAGLAAGRDWSGEAKQVCDLSDEIASERERRGGGRG